MITVEEFKIEAEARGYKPLTQADRPELLIIRSNNGVKVEINIKAKTYIAGYNLSPEKREALKKRLASSGLFQMTFPNRALAYAVYEGLSKFWLWTETIEGIDFSSIPSGVTSPIIPVNIGTAQPISFDEFSAACQAHGYEAKIHSQRPELFVAKTKNGVKVEVNTKSRSYIAGYGLNEEEMSALKAELLRQQELGVFELKFPDRKLAYAKYEGMEKFIEWVRIIEGIDAIVASTRGFAKKVFSKEQAEELIFEKIARTYQFALRLKHQNLLDTSRMLLEADRLDHLITVGQSVNAPEDNPYREHVVPCVLIHNEVIRILLDAGVLENEVSESVIQEIASLIESNLAIVLISREEQNRLDVELGLRTSMPKDWKFGDSIYARLDAAEIEWDNPDEEV